MNIKYIIIVFVFATTLTIATSGADIVSHDETPVLELEPAGEGTYTQIDDGTGEIHIILTEENPNLNAAGVNPKALTDIGPVFTVENVLEQQSNATVWIDHPNDAVEFYVPGEGTVESQVDGVFMQPGDSETIAMRVDTRDTDEITLDSIDVMAVLDPTVGTGDSGGDDSQFNSAEDSGDDDDSDTVAPDSTGPDTETESTPEDSETTPSTPDRSQSTPTPTATDASAAGDETTETDGQPDVLAGLGLWALLVLLLLLAGVLATMLLRRRLGGN